MKSINTKCLLDIAQRIMWSILVFSAGFYLSKYLNNTPNHIKPESVYFQPLIKWNWDNKIALYRNDNAWVMCDSLNYPRSKYHKCKITMYESLDNEHFYFTDSLYTNDSLFVKVEY